jgi:thioredoxin
MTITLSIIGGFFALYIVLVIVNKKRMQKLPNTPDHKNIKTLNSKNFKHQTKSGIVMVDFWAPWCGPCKMMSPILNDIAETESDNVSVGKVNVDLQKELAQKYKIRSIPTLVMLKNGKEVKRFAGVKTKQFLMNEVGNL